MDIVIFLKSGEYIDYPRLFQNYNLQLLKYQIPDESWFTGLGLHPDDVVEVYNHYLIWKDVLTTGKSRIILTDQTFPNTPNLPELFLVPNADLVLFGKYNDRCDLYELIIKNQNFGLYKTTNAFGGYAYLVTPNGAKKLALSLIKNPTPLDNLINRISSIGNVLTYHPSIIYSGKPECLNSGMSQEQFWLIIILLFILFIFIAAVIFGVHYYYSSVMIGYQPNKMILID